MKHTLMLASLAVAFAAPLAHAQSDHKHGGHGAHGAQQTPAPAATVQAKGTLKKIDAARNVVTLTHEPIPALGWPAMTMDLKVRDAKVLEGAKAGQAIVFDLEKDGSAYVITKIVTAK